MIMVSRSLPNGHPHKLLTAHHGRGCDFLSAIAIVFVVRILQSMFMSWIECKPFLFDIKTHVLSTHAHRILPTTILFICSLARFYWIELKKKNRNKTLLCCVGTQLQYGSIESKNLTTPSSMANSVLTINRIIYAKRQSTHLCVQCCMAAGVFLCVLHVPNRRLTQHIWHPRPSDRCTMPSLHLCVKLRWKRKKCIYYYRWLELVQVMYVFNGFDYCRLVAVPTLPRLRCQHTHARMYTHSHTHKMARSRLFFFLFLLQFHTFILPYSFST